MNRESSRTGSNSTAAGDQNQGTVALLEGAIQPVEQALEIRQAKVDEGEPHRGDVAVRGACAQLAEMLVGAVAVSRTAIGIAEDADVVDRPAAQLDRFVELLDRAIGIDRVCVQASPSA